MSIVRDYRTLKAMERRGFVRLMDGASRHWTGMPVRNYYVSEGPALSNWYDHFTYRGQEYRLAYIDGCFHPFVAQVGKPLPEFV